MAEKREEGAEENPDKRDGPEEDDKKDEGLTEDAPESRDTDTAGEDSVSDKDAKSGDVQSKVSRYKGLKMPRAPKALLCLSKPMLLILVLGIAVALVLSIAFMTGLFGGKGEDNTNLDFNLVDTETETITWVDQPFYMEGDITGGGPGEFIEDTKAPFIVNDTVSSIKVVLTWDPQSHDLDLTVLDPGDREAASSGNAPGEPETVEIKSRIKAGEWNLAIDPFFTVNVHWTAEITFTHEAEIGGSSGDDGGSSGGSIMHQKTEECADKTDSGTTKFDPGEDYEILLIQFSAESADGKMSIVVKNPDDKVVFKKTVSGTDEAAEQGSVESMPGNWLVEYEWEGFTGEYAVQIIAT